MLGAEASLIIVPRCGDARKPQGGPGAPDPPLPVPTVQTGTSCPTPVPPTVTVPAHRRLWEQARLTLRAGQRGRAAAPWGRMTRSEQDPHSVAPGGWGGPGTTAGPSFPASPPHSPAGLSCNRSILTVHPQRPASVCLPGSSSQDVGMGGRSTRWPLTGPWRGSEDQILCQGMGKPRHAAVACPALHGAVGPKHQLCAQRIRRQGRFSGSRPLLLTPQMPRIEKTQAGHQLRAAVQASEAAVKHLKRHLPEMRGPDWGVSALGTEQGCGAPVGSHCPLCCQPWASPT